jgi:hypothetical protein
LFSSDFRNKKDGWPYVRDSAVLAHSERIGPVVEKQRHHGLVATSGCVVEWRFVLLVGLVDIHTSALYGRETHWLSALPVHDRPD